MKNDKKILEKHVMNNVRLPIITFSEPFTYLGVGAIAGTQTPLVSLELMINLPHQNHRSSREPGSLQINL